MIKYSAGVVLYNVDQFNFPGGEVGIKLTSLSEIGWSRCDDHRITIKACLKNSDDIMALLLTVDAIRRQNPYCDLELYLPYVPYARQDRHMVEGDSLSIAVMAQLINSCNFKRVTIYDPHSDVTSALINNVRVISAEEVFHKIKSSWANTWIVAPDAGAYKKAHRFAQKVNAAGVLSCSKDRDLATGEITGMKCDADTQGKDLLVVDDICDGGRTFIELAKALGPHCEKLELAVTHGIFSKGFEVVADVYDTVYTTTSYHGERLSVPDNVKWVEVF